MDEMTEAEEKALAESELMALMAMYPEDYPYNDPEDEGTSVGDLIKQAAKLGGAVGLLGLEKIGIDTGPMIQKYKEGFNKGGLASRPIDPVMEVDGGFLVLTPEKHEDGAPMWRFIPEDVPVPTTSIRPQLRPEISEEEMRQAFYETKDELVRQAAIEAGLVEPKQFAENEYALGGLAVARKGIETEEGEEMANKKFQLDRNAADVDDNNEVTPYEQARGEAIQKAMMDNDPEAEEKIGMYHGGMPCGCDEGLMTDPVSGNEIPIGSSAENVRDDIEIMISEGEYVLPADVVKWHGLRHIMDMEAEAKMGLMGMYAQGLIQYVDEEGSVEEEVEEAEEVTETPEGNGVEVASVEVTEEEPEVNETEEYQESEYGTKTSLYGMMKPKKVAFIS